VLHPCTSWFQMLISAKFAKQEQVLEKLEQLLGQ
jgi:hypothetical protein